MRLFQNLFFLKKKSENNINNEIMNEVVDQLSNNFPYYLSSFILILKYIHFLIFQFYFQ